MQCSAPQPLAFPFTNCILVWQFLAWVVLQIVLMHSILPNNCCLVVVNIALCTRHWDIAAVFICICILGRLEVEVVVAWASADMLGPSVKVDDRTMGHSLSKVSGIPNLGRLAILQRDHAWIVLLATVSTNSGRAHPDVPSQDVRGNVSPHLGLWNQHTAAWLPVISSFANSAMQLGDV